MSKNILKALNRKPIAYYPIYHEITGSIHGAILLSQLMYWLSKKDKIFKTNNEIREEIGFSERELKTAKTALKNVGFIKVSREGLPAKTYYEIDWDEYEKAIDSVQTSQDETVPTGCDETVPTGDDETVPSINDKSFETTTETTTENTPNPSEGQGELLNRIKAIQQECLTCGSKGRLSKREFEEAVGYAKRIGDPKEFASSFKRHLEEQGKYAKRLINFMADYAAEQAKREEAVAKRRIKDGFVEEYVPGVGWMNIGRVEDIGGVA